MNQNQTTLLLPPLFCKTADEPVFCRHVPLFDADISFRPLHLTSDLDVIFQWVNETYARRFWQLNGSRQLLEDTYTALLLNPHAHSFIGLINNQPVAQVDIYQVAADELGKHLPAAPNDCGLHLLMLPPRLSRKHLSRELLRSFIQFYFSFSEAGDLFAEPDQENVPANRLARETGFSFVKAVSLSNKSANLYCITRKQYISSHP